MRRISSLNDPHVAYYLLRHSGNASRMTYLARMTPLAYCSAALKHFDDATRSAAITGQAYSDAQWGQAALPLGRVGLGLRPSLCTADAAHIGSKAAIHELCTALWSQQTWDVDVPSSHLSAAIDRCNSFLSGFGMASRVDREYLGTTQRKISTLLGEGQLRQWRLQLLRTTYAV